MMGWDDGGWGWGGWLAMTLMMLVFWGGLAAVVVALVRSSRPPASAPDPGRDARGILDERFARGDIDEDEYRRRREALHRS